MSDRTRRVPRGFRGLEPDACLPAAPSIEGVTLSNGMCWGRSEGKKEGDAFDIFYFIDSALQTVDSFVYDEATGEFDLASRKTVVKVPALADGGGVPDGMTIDCDGNLWVALGESGCVVQYDPRTGDELMVCCLPILNGSLASRLSSANSGSLLLTTFDNLLFLQWS